MNLINKAMENKGMNYDQYCDLFEPYDPTFIVPDESVIGKIVFIDGVKYICGYGAKGINSSSAFESMGLEVEC